MLLWSSRKEASLRSSHRAPDRSDSLYYSDRTVPKEIFEKIVHVAGPTKIRGFPKVPAFEREHACKNPQVKLRKVPQPLFELVA